MVCICHGTWTDTEPRSATVCVCVWSEMNSELYRRDTGEKCISPLGGDVYVKKYAPKDVCCVTLSILGEGGQGITLWRAFAQSPFNA